MKLHEYNEMMSYVLRRRPMSMGGIINRQNLYDGGVVEFAKNLSNQGKSTDEILEAIQKQFPDLPGGKKGKPTEKTGLQNILKKELSSEVYNQRHGAKRFTQETIDKYLELRDTMNKAQIQKELDISPAKQGKIDKEYGLDRRKSIVTDRKFSPEDIEEFKRLRPIMSETEIAEELGMSKSYQTQLARELGLPSKTGKQVLSKKIAEAESVVPTIKKMIDPNKSPTENLKEIYPKIKDKTFKKGTTQFGKPTEDRVRRAISNALMDVNQLSVEEYKDEIRKMIANRNYAPKGLDPLRIKTDELKNYAIPNYQQAKTELADEIPSLDRRIQTNINIRKKLKRKQKEIADPSLKLSRLSQKARRRQIKRLEKLGLTTKLSPREEAINQTQTSIQKSSNDRIKANPEAMKKFLQDNPEKLKALGTRVNRQTGEIFYENPNLGFLNKDPKDTARFFELDHGREISKQAGRLTDVPENRNTIPGLLNRGFKRDAEIYIESNPNPKDPKVQAVLEEAKKLKVRIRPNVPTGTFKADDFFRPVANPLLKISDNISFYAPNEFQTKEVVLPRDKTGKVVLGLSTKQPGGPTLGANLGLLKGLGTAAEVVGTPAAAALFAADTVRRNIREGQSLADAVVDPMVGVDLLLPTAASRFAPGVMRGVLGLGKVGRAFTPIGATLAIAGQGQEFYNQFQELQRLKEEDPEAYRKFIATRITDPLTAEELADIEDMGREGAMYGGRMGFAKGPKDPSRRKFIKVMGGLASLPIIGKYFKLAEPISKAAPAVSEGVKLGADKLMMLVEKIKLLGKSADDLATQERQKVTKYEGKDGSEYELVEDLTTGDISVTRDKPGVAVYGRGTDDVEGVDVIEDRSTFTIRRGEEGIKDEGLETQKSFKEPDEYEEGRAVFDQDGTVADIDDVDDEVIKAIEDEIK